MLKTYSDFMKDITADELYEKLIEFGMFSEKLPPVFDGSSFLSYCKNPGRVPFADSWYPYVSYNNIRNINIPRPIGVPTPMAHEHLCKCLSNNWELIRQHFNDCTASQNHKVSRIHIRKMKDSDALFIMSYKNWKSDGSPEPDITIGKKYVVYADISKCFPSVYSHALAWALAGKDEAKKNVGDRRKWYNAIDYWTSRSKNGETHGLLIGPHTSNVLSEIILCSVDKELTPKYDYIRNIDDYTCYVSSRDQAEQFLVDLNTELEKYDLSLNHKKTEIVELPVGAVEQWVSRIEDRFSTFGKFKEYVDYKEVRALIDYCIILMGQNQENTSILLYAMKTLSGKDKAGVIKYKLSKNAKEYCVQRMSALALLYPYIVPWLDEYVFSQFDASIENIESITRKIYDSNMKRRNYEACSYSLFFASKYGFCLDPVFDLSEVIKSNDCILLMMALIYCRKIKWRGGVSILRKHANSLLQTYMNEYWIFIYECLNGSLSGNWKELKKAKVSFLKSEYQT